MLCYQTRDANNNHCKYNDILFSIVFATYYSLYSFNISNVLFSFDTTSCFKRRDYNMLMLKKQDTLIQMQLLQLFSSIMLLSFVLKNESVCLMKKMFSNCLLC